MSGRKSKRDLKRAVEHLRETLTNDMAEKAYRCRYGEDPDDSVLDEFIEELINEHYNAGLDEWDDEFLYTD